MFSLRVLGGPVPKDQKVIINVTPSTTFEAMIPMIQSKLFADGFVVTPDAVAPDLFDLVELEFVEGGKAKPARVLSLTETPKSMRLSAPALLLRAKPASSGPAAASSSSHVASSQTSQTTAGGAADGRLFSPLAAAAAVAANASFGSTATSLPPLLHSPSRSFSAHEFEPLAIPDTATNQVSVLAASLAGARSSRERLSIIYCVSAKDSVQMLPIDRVLRRAQAKGKVELLIAYAERALLPLAAAMHRLSKSERSDSLPEIYNSSLVMKSPSSSQEVVSSTEKLHGVTASPGSPTQLIRRMRHAGMLETKNEDSARNTISLASTHVLLQSLHRECAASLAILFIPSYKLTCRMRSPPIPADFRSFVFESGAWPRASICALLSNMFDLKFMRRDFERFEQQERFCGERSQCIRFEAATRSVIEKMFYAMWCVMQQGRLAVEEQDVRRHLVMQKEARERHSLDRGALVSFELAVRRGYLEAAESRHRLYYLSYDVQTKEHFTRRRLMDTYFMQHRILEVERDLSMASSVMQRMFHRALLGYKELELLRVMDMERIYRGVMAAKEWRIRLLMFEMQEQLYRQWLEETMLTWLAPVVEKIAAKAVADGRILLALEMKEMRNVRAREEARLRVLMRQNSSVRF